MMARFFTELIATISSFSKPKSDISADAEYTRLTNHLDYLDGNIIQFLSQFVTLATLIIAGSFYLATLEAKQIDPSWSWKTSLTLDFVGFASFGFIFFRLLAWFGYRDTLYKRFGSRVGKPGCSGMLSEIFMMIVIIVVCVCFHRWNPLNK